VDWNGERSGLLFSVWVELLEGIGNTFFEILAAEVEDSKGKLNESVWTFSIVEICTLVQGFESNESVLKVSNNLK
jgi:hypothetical protein